MSDDNDYEPPHGASPDRPCPDRTSALWLSTFQDEPDPRRLPDGNQLTGAIADIFDALIAPLVDTRLEPDLDNLLWLTVNLFHRAAERVSRELDVNEQAQRRAQKEQDGSEVKSVELERLIAEGETLVERQDIFEY